MHPEVVQRRAAVVAHAHPPTACVASMATAARRSATAAGRTVGGNVASAPVQPEVPMSVRRVAAWVAAGTLAAAAWVAAAPAVAAPAATSPDALDRYLQEQVHSNGIPGLAVAVVRDGRVEHVAGFGTADGHRPVTGQTPFVLASVSKPITATAVMQLVESGKVSLDAPVQHYLPQFDLADHSAA